MERSRAQRTTKGGLYLRQDIRLEKVPDKDGNPATIYVKFNHEKGRPFRYDTNPDTAQKVAPSNESRTQIAVNNEARPTKPRSTSRNRCSRDRPPQPMKGSSVSRTSPKVRDYKNNTTKSIVNIKEYEDNHCRKTERGS